MNGSITVELTKDTTFGVNPGIAQNYNPFSGNGKTRKRQLFKIEHKLPAGIHTIPLHAVAPVQFSTTSPDDVKRTNEVMPVVDVMRKEGYAKVLNMVLNVNSRLVILTMLFKCSLQQDMVTKRTNIQTNLSK